MMLLVLKHHQNSTPVCPLKLHPGSRAAGEVAVCSGQSKEGRTDGAGSNKEILNMEAEQTGRGTKTSSNVVAAKRSRLKSLE